MKTEKIYRYLPSNSKKYADNFDSRLMNKVITKVQIRYEDDGSISRVDIFCLDREKTL